LKCICRKLDFNLVFALDSFTKEKNMPLTTTRQSFPLTIALALGFAIVSATGLLAAASAQTDASPPADDVSIAPIVWELIEFVDTKNGSEPVGNPEDYTLQFLPDGVLAVGADCNRAVMSYESQGSSLMIAAGAMTLALCAPDSKSDQFIVELGYVSSFTISQESASDQLSLALQADGGFLNFRASLVGVQWQWQRFQGGDGAEVSPGDPSQYTLEFHEDGSVTGQIDCNRAVGTYTADGNRINIVLATTRMACPPGSLDAEFGRYISESNTFVIRDGNLSLALPIDSGIATFAPVVAMPDDSGTPESEG
jgi:heat shock protein HslJ